MLFEAPNWSVSGDALLLNGDGVLWSLEPVAGADAGADRARGAAGDQQRPRARPRRRAHLPVRGGRADLPGADRRRHARRGSPRDDGRLALPARRLAGRHPARLRADGVVRGARPARRDRAPTAARRRSSTPARGTSTDPSGPRTVRGCTSTPSAGRASRGTRSSPACPTGAVTSSGSLTSGTVDWFPHLSPDGADRGLHRVPDRHGRAPRGQGRGAGRRRPDGLGVAARADPAARRPGDHQREQLGAGLAADSPTCRTRRRADRARARPRRPDGPLHRGDGHDQRLLRATVRRDRHAGLGAEPGHGSQAPAAAGRRSSTSPAT